MNELITAAIIGLNQDAVYDSDTLLTKVAIKSLQAELGQMPAKTRAIVKQESQEIRELCPLPLSQKLAAMLEGKHTELLSELLELIAKSELRIPAELLPAVLERGLKYSHLRPAIIDVISLTGQALADENKHWAYASAAMNSWDGIQAEWSYKSIHRRQGILAQIRASNPDLGRQLVESSWETESLSSAIWILNFFGKNLVSADEAFLERALDNRNSSVRRKAADYLKSIAGSRLSLRMQENIGHYIDYNPQKQAIEVNLPLEYSAEMRRDGVMKRLWQDRLKVQNAEIADMISAVSLDYFTENWQLDIKNIINLLKNHKYSEGLLKGFSKAAENQKNISWALNILRLDDVSLSSSKLLSVLDADDFEVLISQLDNDDLLDKENPMLRAIWRYQGGWTTKVLDIWLKRLTGLVEQIPILEVADLSLRSSLKQSARLCVPADLERLINYLKTLIKENPSWKPVCHEALAIAKFRRGFYRALEGE